MDINKLDYQKLVIYGVLLLIGVYFMRDMLDLKFKIPILETFEGHEFIYVRTRWKFIFISGSCRNNKGGNVFRKGKRKGI